MAAQIVVPVDGSEHAQKALDFACVLADKFDAHLHILHVAQAVVHDQMMFMGGVTLSLESTRSEIEKAGQAVLDSALETVQGKGIEAVSSELTNGDPAQQIVDCAKDRNADMIVIGSRGFGAFKSLLLGSVSDRVNHMAGCICVTVR